MSFELTALFVAAAVLAAAILFARQTRLMMAVLAYAAVVNWIIHRDMDLLMMALGIAIALGALGLGVVVSREILSQDDTEHHTSRKLRANSQTMAETIGS